MVGWDVMTGRSGPRCIPRRLRKLPLEVLTAC